MLSKEVLLRKMSEAGWFVVGSGLVQSIVGLTAHSKDGFAADYWLLGICIAVIGGSVAMTFAHVASINTSLYKKVDLILTGVLCSIIFFWIAIPSHRATTDTSIWLTGCGIAIYLVRILIALLVFEARASNTNHQGK